MEAEKAKLADEKKVLLALKKQYAEAAKDVQGRIHIHTNKINIMLDEWDELDDEKRSILQSQIYQKQFQEQLKAQIEETVKKLNDGQYKSIQDYLNDSYTTAAAGSAYDMHGQGVPLIMPIDRKAMVKSVELDPKLSKKLYGSYMEQMKDSIRAEVSRGIATADSYEHIARNISNKTNQGFNKTMRIVRTEGHRIQVEAAFEQQQKAKQTGADIVKQWDSTLDGRTRPTHRKLDGQIREIDDYFEVNGHRAKYPSGFGRPEEDINCRCALLQRARWALDDEELETLKKRAEYFGLDKTEDFKDFKKKYLKAAEYIGAVGLAAKISGDGIPEHEEPKKVKQIDYADKKAVAAAVSEFEAGAVSETIETAYVITADGEVFMCYGTEDRVFPDFDLNEKLYGATITHNHPIEETEHSFSKDDLNLFLQYNLVVLRGCDELYTYEFTRNPEEIDEPPEDWMDFENFAHIAMIEMAKANGIGYRRWKNEQSGSE